MPTKNKESKKDEKNQENKEIRIPIPNTRFLLKGIKQTDSSWLTSILDPHTQEERLITDHAPTDNGMLIMISCLTNKIFTSSKIGSIKEITKIINKIIKTNKQTYGKQHKRINRSNNAERINKQSKRPQNNRKKRLKNGVNKPNTRRNKQIGKKSKNNR